LNPQEAIRFLSEPEVMVDYPEKILQTLVNNAGPRIAVLFLNISHEWFDNDDFHTKEMDILCQIDLCDALMFQVSMRAINMYTKRVLIGD